MSDIQVTSSDPLIQLAALMIENDSVQDEANQQALDAARRAEERAGAEQVAALRDAASAVATGALVEGGLRVVGGVTSGIAIGEGGTSETGPADMKVLARSGDAVTSLGAPLGALTGEAPKLRAQAEATRAEHAANLASNDIETARERLSHGDHHASAVLDLLEKCLETEAQGTAAVLGNF